MNAIKWAIVCGVLNAVATASVVWMAMFTNISEGVALSVGAMFVLASAWPYLKAQNAYAAEQASA